MTEPTLAETLRRMENIASTLTTRMSELAVDLKETRSYADVTYARRETVLAWREADRSDIEEVKRARETDAAFRRQMLLGLGTTTIIALVSIILGVVSFLGTR
jgi:hypothetical protein